MRKLSLDRGLTHRYAWAREEGCAKILPTTPGTIARRCTISSLSVSILMRIQKVMSSSSLQLSSSPRLPLTAGLRLIALLATCSMSLTACGGCDGDDTPPGNDMTVTPEDLGMEPDEGMPEDLAMPDLAMPDLAMPDLDTMPDLSMPPDMMAPIPDGPEVKPLSFSMFPPIPVSCDNPGENSRYRIPISILAEEEETKVRRPLRPYDRVAGRPLIINETVNVGAIAAERIRISRDDGTACSSNADCEAGFVCATAGNREASNICLRRTGISFIPDSTRVDYDPGGTGKQQLVSILYENSGGLLGFTPLEVGELFDDAGQKDLFKLDARATDAATISRIAMEQFVIYLASYVDLANTQVSAWWFAGDKPVEAVAITKPMASDDHFISNLEEPASAYLDIPRPSARLGTGNVYQAIHRVIEKDLGLDKYADFEKFLFVVVDGPNEVWDESATRETVLDALNEHDIHIFFIHFDQAIDASLKRDPLSYWAGNQRCRDESCGTADPCATDNDCQNFEECRPVTLYSEAAGTPTTQTPLSYCLPKYRDDGRLGPINAYADLACRTNGNYFYFTSPRALEPTLKELPPAIDGQWSFEADISYLDPDKLSAGFYRMSGVFLGLFGNSSIGTTLTSDIYEPCFGQPDQLCVTTRDNRPMIRLGNIE